MHEPGAKGLAIAMMALSLASCGGEHTTISPPARRQPAANELLGVAELDAVTPRAERSRQLFAEAARVIRHPRCLNCHPAGDTPHQRLAMELHDPPVVRGPNDRGVPGLECATCHQDRNQPLTRVPGAASWHLAPIAMAWVGKSVRDICLQLKDPTRNGGRTLAKVAEHAAHDELVGWAWHPGADREPAPGTQAQFGALVAAWIETGAECPQESR